MPDLARLRAKRLFLLDLDGTLYLDERLFDGAADFLRAIRSRGGTYRFLTNNSSRGAESYVEKLRRLGVDTVVLAGTTTPNCIRTTCYDAIALEYNTVVLTDCCSSHTEEIQRVNLEDMARAGAILMDSASFADYGPGTVEDLSAAIRARMLEEDTVPEPFRSEDGQVFWPDLW